MWLVIWSPIVKHPKDYIWTNSLVFPFFKCKWLDCIGTHIPPIPRYIHKYFHIYTIYSDVYIQFHISLL